jgi:hypothetical protein
MDNLGAHRLSKCAVINECFLFKNEGENETSVLCPFPLPTDPEVSQTMIKN